MVAGIDFFEMSEICRPKFIVRHSTRVSLLHYRYDYSILNVFVTVDLLKSTITKTFKIFNHIGSVINRPKLERPRKKILSMSY
jgi:hypothetical protein